MRTAVVGVPGTVIVAAALACTGPAGGAPAGSTGNTATAQPDSIVLERTVCFGFCPAYRLHIASTGAVRFEPRALRDSVAAAEHDTIPENATAGLLAQARAIGFFALPDEITPANSAACPLVATDHPSAIVTIAIGDMVKRVNHYHGCHAQQGDHLGDAYPALTAFEAAIDSAVRVIRWLPPPR
jgi:hypothetical protein